MAATTAVAVTIGLAGCSSSGSAGPTTTSTAAHLGARISDRAPVPSPGCAVAPGPSVTSQQDTITVGGSSRSYLLDTPAPGTPSPTQSATSSPTTKAGTVPATPRPLVLDFHGLDEGAVIHSATSQFGVLGQKDGFVVVFPQGTGSPVQWDTTDQSSTNPDLQYVTALLQQVESTKCIDTSRVYASGFSDGSFMVSLLACTMSNRFAAIAAVSGLQLDKPCPTTRKVPILAFHGTADPILFFNGGLGSATLNQLIGPPSATPTSAPTTTTTLPAKLHGPGYPATVQAWAVKDGCSPHSTDTKLSSQVILRTYHCPAGTDVEFYIILGGGHAWPGSKVSQAISKLTGFTTFQISATPVIWRFFHRFAL
jgi:polyhydroxybutyrate depolymerase